MYIVVGSDGKWYGSVNDLDTARSIAVNQAIKAGGCESAVIYEGKEVELRFPGDTPGPRGGGRYYWTA